MPFDIASFITRTPLDNLSIRYANEATAYVSEKLFPLKTVPKKTGSFYVLSKDNLRNDPTRAPSGTEAPSGGYTASTKTFTLGEFAWKGLVLEKDARDADKAVADLNTEQAMHNMDKLLLDMEQKMATKVLTSGNWPASLVTTLSGNGWADDSSDPAEDVRNMRQTAFENSMRYPNYGYCNQKTVDILRKHPAILEYFKYTGAGKVTADQLASFFDLQGIYVSNALSNTANEGAADTLGYVWADSFVLAYQDPNPGLRTITFGQTFIGQQFYTKTIDAPELGRGLGAHWLESGMEYDHEFIARDASDKPLAGALIVNTY